MRATVYLIVVGKHESHPTQDLHQPINAQWMEAQAFIRANSDLLQKQIVKV